MQHRSLLAILGLAQLMVVLDFSIVNVALPSLAHDLAVTPLRAQWVITGYAVALGGALLFAGRAADLFGRRRMFAGGLGLFAAASLAGGFAPDIRLVILARIAQGVGAAMLSPAALSLITTTFTDESDRNRALGIFGAVSAIGFALGALLGGIMTEWLGWRWVFFVNVPLALLALALTPFFVPRGKGQRGVGLDVPGALLVTLAMTILVLAIGGAASRPRWLTLGLLLAGLLCALAFVHVERKAAQPLVPLAILRTRGLLSAMVMVVIFAGAAAASTLILSLYIQGTLGRGPLETGLTFLPAGLAGLATGALAPRAMQRFSVDHVLSAALVLIAVSLAAIVFIQPTSGLWLVRLAYPFTGAGIVAGMFAATVRGTSSMGERHQGLASGLLNSSHEVGAAVAVAMSMFVVGWFTRVESVDLTIAYRFVLWGIAIAAMIAFFASWASGSSSPRSNAPSARTRAAGLVAMPFGRRKR